MFGSAITFPNPSFFGWLGKVLSNQLQSISAYSERQSFIQEARLTRMNFMKNLLVRRATYSDVEKLTELGILLQQHSEKSNSLIWRITAEGKALLREKVENELVDAKRHTFVAEMNGEIIGFIQGEVEKRTDYFPRTVGSISTAYVVGNFRRKGVGRMLVKRLCEFFSSEGVEDVTLRYIIGNKEAERFWEKLGFQPVITTAKTVLDRLKSGTSVSNSA